MWYTMVFLRFLLYKADKQSHVQRCLFTNVRPRKKVHIVINLLKNNTYFSEVRYFILVYTDFKVSSFRWPK